MEVTELLKERSSKHGNAQEQFGIAQALKREFEHWLEQNPRYEEVKNTVTGEMIKEGLDMTATKLSRILAGDCTFYDHWQDVSGYNKIVSDFLESNIGK